MPVSDFECQIARGQIGRYLDGGALSSQAMTGLEEHLADCPGCKALVAERRAALVGALGGEASKRAVVSMPVENPLIAALRAKSETAVKAETPKTKAAPRYAREKAPSKRPLGKPLALAALLAVVLLGMSRVSQFVGAPTTRASTSFAAESMPDAAKLAEATKPTNTPAIAEKAPVETKPVVETPAPEVETPKVVSKKTVVKPLVEKKPVVVLNAPKPAPRPIARRPLKRRVAVRRASKLALKSGSKLPHSQRKSRSTVRVYGLDGRPLKP